MDEVCEEAIEKGVKGIAITDHVDFRYFDVRDNLLEEIDRFGKKAYTDTYFEEDL